MPREQVKQCMKSEVRCRWNNGLTITVDWLVLLASKVMARTGSEYHSIGGDFSAAKGELRKLNVTAGMGGKSYLAYQKVPARLAAFCEYPGADRHPRE